MKGCLSLWVSSEKYLKIPGFKIVSHMKDLSFSFPTIPLCLWMINVKQRRLTKIFFKNVCMSLLISTTFNFFCVLFSMSGKELFLHNLLFGFTCMYVQKMYFSKVSLLVDQLFIEKHIYLT